MVLVFLCSALLFAIYYFQRINPVHIAHVRVRNHMQIPAQHGFGTKYYVVEDHYLYLNGGMNTPPTCHYCSYTNWSRMKDNCRYTVLQRWTGDIILILKHDCS